MKSLNFKAIAALMISATMLLTGCRKDPNVLTVSPSELSFNAVDQSTKSFSISTDAKSWSFTSSGNWATLTQSGNQLNVTVNDNSDTSQRSMTVTISAGTAEQVMVTITQAARDNLSSGASTVTLSGDDISPQDITITTSASDWSATSDASWLTLTKQGANTLRVAAKEKNPTVNQRSATVTVTAGTAAPMTITVIQNGATPVLSASPTKLSFVATNASSQSVSITTNVSAWDATTNASWITLSKSGTSLKVSVSDNTGSSSRTDEITVTAGNASPVKISVTQESGKMEIPSTYDGALLFYYGNEQKTGTALFLLYIYKTNDYNVGFVLQGYGTLTSSPKTFKLATGTWTVAYATTVKTIYPGGLMNSGDLGGSYIFNDNINKNVIITGGTCTVSYSGNICTIKTNFNGKDSDTGTAYDNIVMNFTGGIEIEDESNDLNWPFQKSIYSATGTPDGDSGINSWSGVITPTTGTSGNQFYTLSGWAKSSLPVYFDCNNNSLTIDDYSKIGTVSGYDIYFKAIRLNNSQNTYAVMSKYPVTYNSSTNTLSFTATNSGLPVYVGLCAFDQAGNWKGYINEIHTNVLLKLTATSSAPVQNNAPLNLSDMKLVKWDKPYKPEPSSPELNTRSVMIDKTPASPSSPYSLLKELPYKKSNKQ
jgi:hypothetical protein